MGRLRARLADLDWPALERSLDAHGFARTPPLLDARECEALIALYGADERFRTRIDMARHRFGEGDYAYFAHPLPGGVRELRTHLYRRLAPIANRWAQRAGDAPRYPPTLRAFLAHCHARGQRRPTPLLLRYRTGGYNCLHQDLYGEVRFPLQATLFLSRPEVDYSGGEFLLVEQRPRSQARATALRCERGELLVFPSAERPVAGRRGWLRANLRHGVSTVTSGSRYALGLIFHDAR